MAIGAFKLAIQIAAELEATSLIIHPMDPDYPNDVAQGTKLDKITDAFAVLVEYAEPYNVKIAVENVHEPHSQTILAHLFQNIESLKLCYDIGHANIWDKDKAYIPDYIDRISALHLHDNHGICDEHLIPGEGTIDFPSFFKILKKYNYDGYLGLECLNTIDPPPTPYDHATLIWKRLQDE